MALPPLAERPPLPLWYCDFAEPPWHKPYHDHVYGFPVRDDNRLFERLVLEMNQAGLSWLTILKKEEAFRRAYRGFEIDKVARYGEKQIARLMDDAGIIRNRRKIEAAIENARRIRALQHEHGSFVAWLDHHHPLSREEWTKLFKRTFVFTGGEITNEFLVSTGYLPHAHREDCPAYEAILKLNPPWAR
ncbi:MAG TPA: DNA-3-methyladenine glycosylase I [bacterium]|nr:DNA-3-methyladenine glycosylase I [bacterium]